MINFNKLINLIIGLELCTENVHEQKIRYQAKNRKIYT